MDAFSIDPPEWTERAIHSVNFCCPSCKSDPNNASNVWLNRRAPVTDGEFGRKWQEFYWCECDTVWWGWSSDRPQKDLGNE